MTILLPDTTRRRFLLGLSAASALIVVPKLPGLAWSDAVNLRVRFAGTFLRGGHVGPHSLPIEIIKIELEPDGSDAAIDVSALDQPSAALEIGLLRGRHLRIRGLIGYDVWDAHRENRQVEICIPVVGEWYYSGPFRITEIRSVLV
jgi:hypothetical protein